MASQLPDSQAVPPISTGLPGITLRPGTKEDALAVIRLMDIATEWLVSQGREGQWGKEKHYKNPTRVKQAEDFVENATTWLAVHEAELAAYRPPQEGADVIEDSADSETRKGLIAGIVGAVTVGQASSYVAPATVPELYVSFLCADRRFKGVGSVLLKKAKDLARDAGVAQMRVDCYAGDDGKLVRYYESQGFVKVEDFVVKGWPGALLILRLDGAGVEGSKP
jgi:GNAT superfamily N-acetyltransferase